jgi:crossover junction endodeoxyribonuclease RuvC
MYIYGLDISLSNTGVCVLNAITYDPVLIASIPTKSTQTRGQRLHSIREQMNKIVIQYPPDTVVIENSFNKFNKEVKAIQNAVGVILEVLHPYGEPIAYAPLTIKKEITGNGKASKDVVRKYIERAYPDVKFSDLDQSDAFGICITHLIKTKQIKWNIGELVNKKKKKK